MFYNVLKKLKTEIISIKILGILLTLIKKILIFYLLLFKIQIKGFFTNKRQNLEKKYMSKFQVIIFSEFIENKLYKIAIGIDKNLGFINKKVLED